MTEQTNAKEPLVVKAEARSQSGKGYNRKIRRAGKTPAVLMEKGKSTMLEVNSNQLMKALKQSRDGFDLELAGVVSKVLVKECQIDPVRRTPIHLDFIRA